MEQAVAYQDEARIIWDLAPLVKVERERIGTLDSAQTGSQIGRQYGEGPAGAVDMKPHLLTAR